MTQGGNLNAPLGLLVAANGHVLMVKGNDGFAVETDPAGTPIAATLLDGSGGPPPGAGALFGITLDTQGHLTFPDDATNTLDRF